jgi:hypothetical protein
VPAAAARATLRATTTVAIRARLQKEKKDT